MSICQDCRRSTANHGISDVDRGKCYDLCEDCAPPTCALIPWLEKRAPYPDPVWHCAACGGTAEHARCPIVRDPHGVLHYYHRGCGPPDGWAVILTTTIRAVRAATPEIAEALGIPYEEPEP